MTLTPVEIRHVRLGRRPLGYDRRAVDDLLDRIVGSYEGAWRERADLREELERMDGELARFKELEVLLRNTLVSAERSADAIRGQARREADLILEEARAKARETAVAAETERERIGAEIRRLRSLESDMRSEYKAFLLRSLDRVEADTETREAPERAA
ncbi:MAG TPA: DivIVA domain-containing protein [Gaiellaceae bacterium]|jgi:cell division initiation protein|nr:DivIVA domain-containing protein [Gaiellaceae bacterium]